MDCEYLLLCSQAYAHAQRTTHTTVLNDTFQSSHQFYSKFWTARKVRTGSRNDGCFMYFEKIKCMNLQNNGV